MKKQVFNPYLPSYEYVPDGEPRVFGDRLYIYGSHDRFGAEDFCLNDYVCWSTPLDDLSDWRYEGVIYRKEQDPRNKDGKMHMCAPDCAQGPDGRYYLYYQLHVLQCTSAAVADTPVGPFEYYGTVHHADGTPWGEKKKDSFAFDPGVLVDGKDVWLYIGHSPAPGLYKKVLKLRGNRVEEAVALKLDTDMITVIGDEHPVVPGPVLAKGTDFDGHGFFEANSIRKIGDRYYFVYSSVLSHELCYAVSERPDGGFRYGGTIVSIADIGYKGNKIPDNYTGNTHGGMAEINGQWYIFYHRQTNQLKCNRQGCAEKITIRPDGSIPQVETTSCGLNDGPLEGKGTYEARIACNLSGKDGILNSAEAKKKDKKHRYPYFTQTGTDRELDPDQYIANMKEGSWCAFKYFNFDGSEKKISVKGRGTGRFIVSDGMDHVAEVPVNGSAAFSIKAGIHPLYFTYHGEDASDLISFTIE